MTGTTGQADEFMLATTSSDGNAKMSKETTQTTPAA